jgi:hypothetical protein
MRALAKGTSLDNIIDGYKLAGGVNSGPILPGVTGLPFHIGPLGPHLQPGQPHRAQGQTAAGFQLQTVRALTGV